MQETVYQSLQWNNEIDVPKASSSTNSRANQVSDQSRGGNSSETMTVELQLAMDEALARELQEMENQLAGTSIGETAGTETGKYDNYMAYLEFRRPFYLCNKICKRMGVRARM